MFSLLTLLCSAYVAQAHLKANAAEWSFIKDQDYELLHIEAEDIDESGHGKHIEFDAFDKHYEIELERNDGLISPHFIHADPNYAQMEMDSCHYHGKVLNSDTISFVAVSMCKYSGFVARIKAFGDTIVIKPSATFLDPEHHVKGHSLDEELIVYRQSYLPGAEADAMENPLSMNEKLADIGSSKSHRRNLLAFTAADPPRVEAYVVNGPMRRDNYINSYGTTVNADGVEAWYARLKTDTATMLNEVDLYYSDTLWTIDGTTMGIDVVFKGLAALDSWSGTTEDGVAWSIYPEFASTTCTDLASCTLDMYDLLSKVTEWNVLANELLLANNVFDNLMFVSDANGGGHAWKPGMCATNGRSLSVVAAGTNGYGVFSQLVAHELGHNFALEHNGVAYGGSSCSDSGIMDTSISSATPTIFTACDKQQMTDFFDTYDLSCLNTVSSHGSFITPTLIASLTPAPSISQPSCIQMTGAGSTYNGEWLFYQELSGRPAYQRDISGTVYYWCFRWTSYYIVNSLDYCTTSSTLSFLGKCYSDNMFSCTSIGVSACTETTSKAPTTATANPTTPFPTTAEPTMATAEPTTAALITTAPTTAEPTASGSSCITISDASWSGWNGAWQWYAEINSRPAYLRTVSGTTYYLCSRWGKYYFVHSDNLASCSTGTTVYCYYPKCLTSDVFTCDNFVAAASC